ncbi:hypothetical protein DIPPA_06261 [Diplonema papillatum]|nr:hypothetical protein DIPPA_06261 [Diplonema papillatum]|eukprot:gene15399-23547_t
MYNFGVRLDDGLEHGYFRGAHGMCMTFNSPCLAHAPDFKIMDVEAWALGDEALDASGSGKASALDSKEALKDQKILEFAGREFHREQAD